MKGSYIKGSQMKGSQIKGSQTDKGLLNWWSRVELIKSSCNTKE